MLYEIAHLIKEKFSFIWSLLEWGNAISFAFIYRKRLKFIPDVLKDCSTPFFIREATKNDVDAMAEFFKEQPQDAYTFFSPHGFDLKSLLKVVKNRSFLTFLVLDGSQIVGYFFLRCFVNGKCFRGKIVDYRWRNRGMAKQMGLAMTQVATTLGIRMFGTISPDNYASLASSKAVNQVNIVKTLDNGYYYIEYLPLKE